MDFIASRRRYPGKVRRGASIRNAGKVEIINIYEGNHIQVETVEGVVLRVISSVATDAPNFAVEHVQPIISKNGAFPHLTLTLHGFEMGSSDSEMIEVSTDYPVQED